MPQRVKKNKTANANATAPNLISLLRRYLSMIILLVALTIVASALSIAVPKIIASAIDDYAKNNFVVARLVIEFSIVAVLIFVFTYLQNVVQVYASERVARDLRDEVAAKISLQPYSYIESATPAKLLTNLTSDVDAVKIFVSMAVSSIVSSFFLIIAVAVLLLITDWKLGLAVLGVMPIIGVTFFFVLSKVRKLFVKSQEAIDWLNKVIGESIFGAALIRLLNSQDTEYKKFLAANTEAKSISLEILSLFASLIPVVTFFTNLATLAIVVLGGHFIIQGSMTLGSFTAFNAYLAILIFPIMIIGFMSNVIAQAQASYGRIQQVLKAPVKKQAGNLQAVLRGDIELKNVTVNFGQKSALKDVSFSIKAGTKTAIIGPTAAGKTQLLYLLTGLLAPTAGEILIDGRDINEYDKESLHSQIGFVFQDSVMFNLTLRENIAFSNKVKDEDLAKAIETAELKDYIETLPKKLDTIVSERGTSLSGGQKQRIMLARALALNPKILLLDDFTARVDNRTERKILDNVTAGFPGLTLVSVTQKIAPIEHYDQIILLMEGELLARGTHEELMRSSSEYVQIYQSQRSTNQYESSEEK
jgi:ATP-binding cassette, subfamily B, bacterial